MIFPMTDWGAGAVALFMALVPQGTSRLRGSVSDAPAGRLDGIVISEILFAPADQKGRDVIKFVEIVNRDHPEGRPVRDLLSYVIRSHAGRTYTFPEGTILPAGRTLVILFGTDLPTDWAGVRSLKTDVSLQSGDKQEGSISLLEKGKLVDAVVYDDVDISEESWRGSPIDIPKNISGNWILRRESALAADTDTAGDWDAYPESRYASTPGLPWDTNPVNGSIHGMIADLEGTGIDKVRVSLQHGPSASTNKKGFFDLRGIPSGMHTLKLEREGFATLSRAISKLPDRRGFFQFRLTPNTATDSVRIVDDSNRKVSATWLGPGCSTLTPRSLLLRVPRGKKRKLYLELGGFSLRSSESEDLDYPLKFEFRAPASLGEFHTVCETHNAVGVPTGMAPSPRRTVRGREIWLVGELPKRIDSVSFYAIVTDTGGSPIYWRPVAYTDDPNRNGSPGVWGASWQFRLGRSGSAAFRWDMGISLRFWHDGSSVEDRALVESVPNALLLTAFQPFTGLCPIDSPAQVLKPSVKNQRSTSSLEWVFYTGYLVVDIIGAKTTKFCLPAGPVEHIYIRNRR